MFAPIYVGKARQNCVSIYGNNVYKMQQGNYTLLEMLKKVRYIYVLWFAISYIVLGGGPVESAVQKTHVFTLICQHLQ